jgi:hypothetical protein
MRLDASRTRPIFAGLIIAVLAALALLLPGPTAAKNKDYLVGKILDTKFEKNDRCTSQYSSSTIYHCHFYRMIIQVEDITYQALYEEQRGLLGSHYKFKEDDWPINADVQVRFEVKHLLGLRRTYMFVKRANGKEIELTVWSKTGADGKQLCGDFRC